MADNLVANQPVARVEEQDAEMFGLGMGLAESQIVDQRLRVGEKGPLARLLAQCAQHCLSDQAEPGDRRVVVGKRLGEHARIGAEDLAERAELADQLVGPASVRGAREGSQERVQDLSVPNSLNRWRCRQVAIASKAIIG